MLSREVTRSLKLHLSAAQRRNILFISLKGTLLTFSEPVFMQGPSYSMYLVSCPQDCQSPMIIAIQL